MAFWSDKATEPKRQFRWVFELGGQNTSIESYFVKTAKKPSFTVSEIPLQYVAHTFYYPGRVAWQPIDLTFVDPVVPDTTVTLANIVSAAGYLLPTQVTTAEKSMSKGAFVNAVGAPKLTQIDADGKPIEEWTLWNAFVTNLDFGQLDYASDELVIISMTLRYDYASLNQGLVGRTKPSSQLVP